MDHLFRFSTGVSGQALFHDEGNLFFGCFVLIHLRLVVPRSIQRIEGSKNAEHNTHVARSYTDGDLQARADFLAKKTRASLKGGP